MADPNQERHEADNRHINYELRGNNKKSIPGKGLFKDFWIQAGRLMRKNEDGCRRSTKDNKRDGSCQGHKQDIQ